MNNILISQNLYIILISILNLSYLFRLWKHISIRTSWIIAPIIIFPFLTSLFNNTFFSYILNPTFENFSLNGLDQLIRYWLGGSTTSLFLILIFFLAEKVSLPYLGFSVILELWLICIGSVSFIIKTIGVTRGWPLIFGIIIPILIHSIKISKREKDILENFKKNPKLILNKKTFIRFISGILSIIFLIYTASNQFEISLISISHVTKIILYMSLFISLLIYFKTFNFKVIIYYIPVFILYFFISITSLTYNQIQNDYIFKFNCISSIAFLPLLEYSFVKYYAIKTKLESKLKIKYIKSLSFLIKFIILISIICYASFVLTS